MKRPGASAFIVVLLPSVMGSAAGNPGTEVMAADTTHSKIVFGTTYPKHANDPYDRSDGALAVMNPDGSGRMNLVGGDDSMISIRSPQWSPNGSRIAYVEESSLQVVDSDGGSARELGRGKYEPRWSPDGSRIAFQGHDDQLHVVDVTSGAESMLTQVGDLGSHSWAPDGRRLALSASEGADSTGNSHIFVVDSDGNRIEKLTLGNVDDSWVAWSPDGDWIAFVRHSAPERQSHLFIMKPDGSALTQLTTGLQVTAPVWAPDSQSIAFFENENTYGRDLQETYVASLATRSVRNLTPSEDAYWPTWSPDGAHLAFVSRRDGNEEIYRMRANGTDVTRLTHSAEDDTEPHWGVAAGTSPGPGGGPPPTDTPDEPAPDDPEPEAPGVQVKVMTWNILGKENPELKTGIAVEIRRRAVDIVGLQEIEKHQAKRLKDYLQVHDSRWQWRWVGTGHDPIRPGELEEGHAILSRLPINRATSWPLSDPKGDGDHQRILQRAVITVEGKDLHFYNTHLCSDGEWCKKQGGRAQQAYDLVEYTFEDGLDSPPGFTPVLVGDLNARPLHAAMTTLREYFGDAWIATHPDSASKRCGKGEDAKKRPADTFNEADRICGWTTNTFQPQGRIDYVLFGEGALSAESATTPSFENWTADGEIYNWYHKDDMSDHFPVIATLSLTN